MPKINVMEKHVAELIAAGEVIERPASIVKELTENAIDAGATAVTVEIQRGGVKYIRITDNGCGIAAEDVPTAFLRHATSKVRYEYDLDSIGTLGFRGEALASVCAVARVEMLTKTADAQFGTRIELEGGEQKELTDAGCPDGTTIVVRDLFYNVPARLKFLKRDVYEAGLVSGIVDKLALSHPDVSVKLIKDGKVELHTPGDGKIQSAVYAVFGKEFAKTLIPVEYEYQSIHVSGYASIPDLSKANRKSQHFFVNGRYVKSRTCAGALEEAYRHAIMVGKFPACVLYFRVPNDTVDVNVHPAKTEIRFVNEKTVYDAVYFAVKSAISAYHNSLLREDRATERALQAQSRLSATPRLDYTTKAREFAYQGDQTKWKPQITGQPSAAVQTETRRELCVGGFEIELEQNRKTKIDHVADDGAVYRKEPETEEEIQPEPPIEFPLSQAELKYLDLAQITGTAEKQPEPSQKEEPKQRNDELKQSEKSLPAEAAERAPAAEQPAEDAALRIRLCGELFKTYILAEIDNTFLMIDKHAAHERMIYEKLRTGQGKTEGQLLLTPLTVSLSREDYMALLEHKEDIVEYGFEIDDFGQCSVQVRSIPMFLDLSDAAQVLYELGSGLRKNRRDLSPEVIDDMLHSIACKAAIKANDKSSEEELLAIAKEVYTNENIRYCPHGRPVVVTMTKYELEKKFHRIV